MAANLITEDLIEHAQKIISFVKEGGLLAVSGISLDNLSKLQKSFSSLPLKCLKISKGKQWSGLLFQKGRNSNKIIKVTAHLLDYQKLLLLRKMSTL